MTLRIVALSACLLAGLALADDDTSRAKLMGSWQQDNDNKDNPTVWTIQDKGETLHIVNSVGARKLVEFDCSFIGKECDIKDAGRPAKVSLWFDGPRLVEMETRGSYVWKRLFGVTGEGETMDLEFIQIAPTAKTETQHFKRIAQPPEAH